MVSANLVLLHTVKDIEEGLLVQTLQSLFGRLAEEDVRSLDSHIQVFLRVNHYGHLLSQALLQHSATGILLVLLHQCVDDVLLQRGEYLDIALCVVVADVQPELIEAVGRGAIAVQPDVAALSLAKLLAVALGDERTGQCEGLYLVAQRAANQFCTSSHIAPLVVTAQLQLHAIVLIEIQEVVTLQQLIGELGE